MITKSNGTREHSHHVTVGMPAKPSLGHHEVVVHNTQHLQRVE
jgi:hypothetical protein